MGKVSRRRGPQAVASRLIHAAPHSLLGVLIVLNLAPAGAAPTGRVASDAAAQPAQPAALAAPVSPAATPDALTFDVNWSIVGDAQSSGSSGIYRWQHQRHVSITGSATVHVSARNVVAARPFNLLVTDDLREDDWVDCLHDIYRGHVADPNRYTGGPDPFWWDYALFKPVQNPDGSWHLLGNPFGLSFWVSGNTRVFNYPLDRDMQVSCSGQRSAETIPWHSIYTDVMFPLASIDVPGDTSGKVFGIHGHYQVSDTVIGAPAYAVMDVTYNISLRKVGSCVGAGIPVDAASPAIDDLHLEADVSPGAIPPNKGDTLQPPDPATLTVSVTCDGIPVRNAGVKVAVKAKTNSGGHVHADGPNPRPRGYLRGPGQVNFTRITPQAPSITVMTDGTGKARVDFRPGTDYSAGGAGPCGGNLRGIAGTYEVTATLTDARFRNRTAAKDIEVERTDFIDLPAGANYDIKYNSSAHPQGTWGTPPTTNGIQAVANDFFNAQLAHNQELTKAGGTAWPIVPLGIIDMSLKDGGLFDSGGTNVCAGGTQSAFIPWQIPHQTHLDGHGVDFATDFWRDGTAAGWRRFIWWRNLLRAVGCKYGLWAREATFHLNFDQDAAGWGSYHAGCSRTYEVEQPTLSLSGAPAGTPAGAPAPKSGAATAPDLFVLVEPQFTGDGPLFPAPGQHVSFTLSVNNLLGAADAHAVELTATLPAGLSFAGATPAPSRMAGASQPVWDLGTLAAGAVPQVIDMGTQVGPGVSAGASLTVTARAAGAEAEAVTDNNVAAGGVDTVLPGADLVIDADGLLGAAMAAGSRVTFTLGVLNLGNVTAGNTALTLTLPASVTLAGSVPVTQGVSGGAFLWDLGAIAPGASGLLTVSVSLDAAIAPGDVLTYTLGVATGIDRDTSNNVLSVAQPAVLAGPDDQTWVSVAGADPGELRAGRDVTFTIGYANYGNAVAPTSTLTATFDAGLSVTAIRPAPAWAAGNTLGWDLGALAVGRSGDIVVRAHVNAVSPNGSISTGNIQSAAPDIASGNNVFVDVRLAPSFVTYLPLVVR